MIQKNPPIRLDNFSLLKDLSSDQMNELSSSIQVKNVRKHDYVYATSDTEKKIFFIYSGVIKLLEVTDSGEEFVKEILTEGDIFGRHVEQKKHHSEYAEVLSSRATVLSINLDRFTKIVRENSIVSYNFQLNLIRRIQKLESRNSLLAMADSKKRLLNFLKALATKDNDTPTAGKLVLENYLTQEELAKMILVSRQTFSRLLKDLRKDGIINYHRNRIEISDSELQMQ